MYKDKANDLIFLNITKPLSFHISNIRNNNIKLTTNQIKRLVQKIREVNFPSDSDFLKDISKITINFENEVGLENVNFCWKNVELINPTIKYKTEKYIIFTSIFQINLITKCNQIFIDGTFKSAPKKFYQILNICGYYKDIKGITIDKVELLNELGYDLEDIGIKLANNYIKQAITDGFFHADPHPDNIMILNQEIIFLDLGMMGRISTREREILNDCIQAIVKNDIYEVEKNLLLLSTTTGEVNHIKLRKDIELILSKNASIEIKDTNTLDFINDMFTMLRANNIKLDKDITMLIRGIATIEGVLETISPNISLIDVLSNKVKEESIPNILSKKNIINTGRNIINTSNSLLKLPDESLKLINSINRGEVNFKIELNDSDHKIDKLETLVHQVVIGLVDASLLLGASIVTDIYLRNIYLFISLILSIFLLIRMYIDHINKG